MSFIQIHLLTNQDEEQMRKVFQSMDKDFSGSIDKQELIEGLRKMGNQKPEEEANMIFEMADLDKNGTIEYNEWITATIDKRKILN